LCASHFIQKAATKFRVALIFKWLEALRHAFLRGATMLLNKSILIKGCGCLLAGFQANYPHERASERTLIACNFAMANKTDAAAHTHINILHLSFHIFISVGAHFILC
jgi:hypothetical protein